MGILSSGVPEIFRDLLPSTLIFIFFFLNIRLLEKSFIFHHSCFLLFCERNYSVTLKTMTSLDISAAIEDDEYKARPEENLNYIFGHFLNGTFWGGAEVWLHFGTVTSEPPLRICRTVQAAQSLPTIVITWIFFYFFAIHDFCCSVIENMKLWHFKKTDYCHLLKLNQAYLHVRLCRS